MYTTSPREQERIQTKTKQKMLEKVVQGITATSSPPTTLIKQVHNPPASYLKVEYTNP